jgi:hypothetical protein
MLSGTGPDGGIDGGQPSARPVSLEPIGPPRDLTVAGVWLTDHAGGDPVGLI